MASDRQEGVRPRDGVVSEGVSAEAFVAALMRYGNDAIAVTDRESGRFAVVSDSYCTLTGYTRDELIGRTAFELGLVYDDAVRSEAMRRAGQGSRELNEIRLRCRDGTIRLLESSIRPLADTALMLSISRDITDRRNAEAERQASDERFRAAVESMLDLFALFSAVRDEAGKIVDFWIEYVNDAYCAAVGIDRSHLVGHRLGELFPGFHRSQRFAVYRHAVASGDPVRSESYRGDGMWDAINLAGRALDTITVAVGDSLVMSARDITDRVEAERELELRAQLLDLAHDAVIVCDPQDGRITFWNREAEAVYGYSRSEATGQVIHAFLATVFPKSRRLVDDALARDGRWAGVLRHTRKDGQVIMVSSRQALRRDADGRATAIIELNSDITQRHTTELRVHELNEQLAAANQELASWSETLGRLAGGVAHELNNKLAVILGYTNAATTQLGEDHPARHQLSEVQIAAEHANALTTDLLAFARRQTLAREPIVASQIAEGLRRILGSVLGTPIELVIEDDSGGALVQGDRAQLEHALSYLALNARDAMPDGGRLTVRTEIAPHTTPGAPPTVRISMSDTGTGMSEEVRAHIFEPFFTTKDVGEGTGLGLPAVLGIVEQMGGTIAVDSTPGSGSRFVIDLPELTPPEPADASDSGQSPVQTVLLVEDPDEVRTLLALLLQDTGYRVLQAASGEDALAILQQSSTPIDALLVDMVLPTIDGGEVARCALELMPRLPVIYFSAHPEQTVMGQEIPRGDAFLAKPFTPQQLDHALTTAFAAHNDFRRPDRGQRTPRQQGAI